MRKAKWILAAALGAGLIGSTAYGQQSESQDRSDAHSGHEESSDRSNRDSEDESEQGSDHRSGNQQHSSNQQSDNQGSGNEPGNEETGVSEQGVWRASNLIGQYVKNAQGEDLGTVEDVIIDVRNQKIRYVAVGYGGLFGLGEKLFAVPLDQLRVQSDDDGESMLVLNVEQSCFENANGFTDNDAWPAQADRSFASNSRSQGASQNNRYASRQNGSQRQSANNSGNRSNNQQWSNNGQQTSNGQQWANSNRQGSGQRNQSAQRQQARAFAARFEEFDNDENQIVVETNHGDRRIYNVSQRVRVTSNGQQVDVSDLQEGDQLHVTYQQQPGQEDVVITAIEHSDRNSGNRSAASYGQNRAAGNQFADARRYSYNPDDAGQNDDEQSGVRNASYDQRNAQNRGNDRGQSQPSQVVSGRITSVDDEHVDIRLSNGQSHRVRLSDETRVNLDNESDSEVGDLSEGQMMTARIEAEDGEWSATAINARSSNQNGRSQDQRRQRSDEQSQNSDSSDESSND